MLKEIVTMFYDGLITADECINKLVLEYGLDFDWLRIALEDLPKSILPDELLTALLLAIKRF